MDNHGGDCFSHLCKYIENGHGLFYAGTILGVETNAMQFYPDASKPKAKVHPGIYQRQQGHIDLSTIRGSGFGYRLNEIHRDLPEPVAEYERVVQ